MAYSTERFSENAAGMTGRGALAVYDGRGTTAQGGDNIAAMRSTTGRGFFTGQEVLDAVREASKSDTPGVSFASAQGGGLPCLLLANDRTVINTLYITQATVGGQQVDVIRLIGGNFELEHP